MTEPTEPTDPTTDEAAVVIHWRPGCGFCSALLTGADEAGLEYESRNIWEDQEAADFVRSVADGNETVPTVRIGEVAMVNPTTRQLLQAVAEHAPEALPEGYEPPQQGRIAQAVTKLLGG
jgi:glutaredoxin-like protein